MTERRTPFYDIHLRRAARIVKGGGDFMYPTSFSSPVEEHINVRTNVGMNDLSTMGEVDIKGPGAERLLQLLMVNEVMDMHPGQVRYSTMCDENGLIIDDITAYKFSDEHFMVVTSSGPRKKTAAWIAEHARGMSAYVTDMTGSIALITVQGPRSRDLISEITSGADIGRLKFFRFTTGVINGTEVVISRSGYTGELGYEIYVPSEEAVVLWEYLETAGKPHGILPYGTDALQSLRIEKAFPLAGPDIDGTQNPFEVGLHRWIKFTKRDFIGREALLGLQDMGLDRRWTGLILDSKLPAKNGDAIYSIADVRTFKEKMFTGAEAGDTFDMEAAGAPIGYITSSAKGHSVKKMLALGYLSTSHAYPGARVMVNISGRPTLATVAQTPFFDPQGMRLRAKYPRKLDNPTGESAASAAPSKKTTRRKKSS